MTNAERALLIGAAEALARLLFWKNVDGRTEGRKVQKLIEAVAEERAAGVQRSDDGK